MHSLGPPICITIEGTIFHLYMCQNVVLCEIQVDLKQGARADM